MRTIIAALILYLVAMAAFDTLTFNGRFRSVVWQEASYQAKRVNVEVRHLLVKLGI